MSANAHSRRKNNKRLPSKKTETTRSGDSPNTINSKKSDISQNPQYKSAQAKIPEINEDKISNNIEADSAKDKHSNPNQNSQDIKQSFFYRFVSIIKVVKIELLFGILALILSLGQYFQSGISVRINVTSTWRDGYSSDTRNRVSKFRYLYKNKWLVNCGTNNQCKERINKSIDKLAFASKLYSECLRDDEYIKELISEDIELVRLKENRELTNEEFIQSALKYRNALIECLNTAEAVKAVIDARPLFRWHLLYSDTLEGRYADIIKEITNDLEVFIYSYRKATKRRGTEAWFVLTSKPGESNKNDFFTIGLYVFVLILFLTVIYLLKKRIPIIRVKKERLG